MSSDPLTIARKRLLSSALEQISVRDQCESLGIDYGELREEMETTVAAWTKVMADLDPRFASQHELTVNTFTACVLYGWLLRKTETE